MCPGTFIPVDELNAYTKKAIQEGHIDQQVRDIDIGKAGYWEYNGSNYIWYDLPNPYDNIYYANYINY